MKVEHWLNILISVTSIPLACLLKMFLVCQLEIYFCFRQYNSAVSGGSPKLSSMLGCRQISQ